MFLDISQIQPFLQILLAAGLGVLIGIERDSKRRKAGSRTFSLVCMGSCLFTAMAVFLSSNEVLNIDPARVIQAVAIGIGFLGSGLIVQHKLKVEGLTTAAALWATAAIGITVGLKLYLLAILGTLLTIVILAGFRILEEKMFPDED